MVIKLHKNLFCPYHNGLVNARHMRGNFFHNSLVSKDNKKLLIKNTTAYVCPVCNEAIEFTSLSVESIVNSFIGEKLSH